MHCDAVFVCLTLVAAAQARPPVGRARKWVVIPSPRLPSILEPSPPILSSLLPTISQETAAAAFTFSAVGFNAPLPGKPGNSSNSIPLSSWRAPSNLSSLQAVDESFGVQSWTRGDVASSLAQRVTGVNSSALVATFSSFAIGNTLLANASAATGGLSFTANPLDNLSLATNISFSYTIMLSDGFQFGKGGILPGLFASSGNCSGVTTRNISEDCLSLRLGFDSMGRVMLDTSTPSLWTTNATLPTKRWTTLQQSIFMGPNGVNVTLSIDGRPRAGWTLASGAKGTLDSQRRTKFTLGGIWHDVLLNAGSSVGIQRAFLAGYELVVWA